MEIFLVIAFCILLIIVGGKLSKHFNRLSVISEQRAEEERFYKEALLSAVQGIEKAVTPEAPQEVSPVERLLMANEEIIQKKKLNIAIEQELGIKP